MSYSKDREEFVYRMAEWGVSLALTRSILRNAGIVQRFAEADCSWPVSQEERLRADRAGAAIVSAVRAVCSAWTVTLSGDPRGACVKIQRWKDDRGDSFGGDGWCVPAQGYSARQMERMTGRA